MENELIDWMKDLFGYPSNAFGNLTSGGTLATVTAFIAARDHFNFAPEMMSKAVVYMSEQTNGCVAKSLQIIGMKTAIIRPEIDPERSWGGSYLYV